MAGHELSPITHGQDVGTGKYVSVQEVVEDPETTIPEETPSELKENTLKK